MIDGQVDIAITAPRPVRRANSSGAGYMSISCALPSRTDTGSPGRAKVRLSAAADEPFIALGEQAGLRQLTDQLLADDDVKPDIVFEATEIPTVEGLVAAGFGVAVIPVPRDEGQSKTVHVPISNAGAKREVGFVWDRDTRCCRRLRSVSRTSSAMMRQTHEMRKNYALDTLTQVS